MSDTGITLGEVLGVKGDDVRATLHEHIQESTATSALPAVALGMLADETAQVVSEKLKLDLYDLIFKAWAAVEELREYADPVKHPPGERALLRWGKCTIKAPQAVDVKLSVAGFSLPVLRLTIDLAAEFNSLALTIQGGAVRKLTPGPAKASVALKYRSNTLIQPRSTPELTFEHGIEFPEGLRIA